MARKNKEVSCRMQFGLLKEHVIIPKTTIYISNLGQTMEVDAPVHLFHKLTGASKCVKAGYKQ